MNCTHSKAESAWDLLASAEERRKRELTNFSGLRLTHEFHNLLVTGRRDYNFLAYFRDKYLADRPPGRIASLGCGNGGLERNLVGVFRFPFAEIDGFDLNPKLVEYAAGEVAKLGHDHVHYRQMDLNDPELGEECYDLVIFFHSLHHLNELERVLERVRRALTADGLLLVVEYVGPTRQQWSDRVLAITQELLDLLPPRYKVNLLNPPIPVTYKNLAKRRSVAEVIRGDPSEAVRSGEIMELLAQYFTLIEQKPLGGTILELLFDKIAGNFDETSELERTLILSFQKIEEIALREGIIEPHYVFVVAKK